MQQINIPPSPGGPASRSPMDVESSNKKKQIGADFSGRSVGKVTETRARHKSFIFRKCSFTDDFRSRKLLVDYVGAHLKYSDTSRSKHSLADMFARLLADELLKIPSNVHLPDACVNGVVENFVNECNSGKIQLSYSPGERRTTISEFIASELASYLPAESEVAGFDSKSEEIVKTIADKIVAENSIDISLPDGWERKPTNPVFSQDCRFYGCIVDNNGMPRIYYRQKDIIIKNPNIPDCKPDQTLEEALSNAMLRLPMKADILNRKLLKRIIPHILSFEYSSAMQSQWQLALQNEKTAREELDKLMVFEPGLSAADESVIIGFDAESEGIVKNIVAKMEAENSIDITLPDGWIIKSMETGVFSVSWFIVDNNGMPRIECYDLKCTLNYALACKPERAMAFTILSFDCSVSVKDELESEEFTLQSEDAASEELKELLGCQVFENVKEVLDILMMPDLHLNHGEKLTRHIKPFIDWSNEEGNIQRGFQFLNGKHKNTDVVAKIRKISEIFVEKKDLPLIISICEKTTVCKNAKTNAKSNEYVFLRWEYLHGVNASKDEITSECRNSDYFDDHSC